jgi:peptidoglycan/xylan/chitin deacetylase (PgdA/CDA1 family)
MHALVKSAICAMYKYSGIQPVQERVQIWSGRRFAAVLLFHRVTDAVVPDGLTVGTGYFRELCRRLQRGFNVVPLAEVFRLLASGEEPPVRTVAVTFDDSYRDDLTAARVLAEHGLPACFFLPTAFIDSERPFDPAHAHLPNLNWDEVKEMVRLGHEIGSHTVTHPNMADLSRDQAAMELSESRRILQDRLQLPVRWLAYPFGGREHFREDLLPLAQELGYEGVMSACSGFIYSNMAGQILPRVPVPPFASLLNLELHLTGCLDWWYACKRWARSAGDTLADAESSQAPRKLWLAHSVNPKTRS